MIGIQIGDKETLSEWGMVLGADLTIGKPEQKTDWLEVPAADGALNFSTALTNGRPVYKMRPITFSLISSRGITDPSLSAAPEEEMTLIRRALRSYCHGRERKLWLPDDPEHYFLGLFEIGDKSGYNQNTIPVKVTAYPYRQKTDITEVVVTVPESGIASAICTNEEKPARPTFITDGAVKISYGSVFHIVGAGTYTFRDVMLEAGRNEIEIEGTEGTEVLIRYQEAVL